MIQAKAYCYKVQLETLLLLLVLQPTALLPYRTVSPTRLLSSIVA